MAVLSPGPPDAGFCGDVSNSGGMPRFFRQDGSRESTVAAIEPSRNDGSVAK